MSHRPGAVTVLIIQVYRPRLRTAGLCVGGGGWEVQSPEGMAFKRSCWLTGRQVENPLSSVSASPPPTSSLMQSLLP